MKKAILIASFGTTSETAIQSCILPLERAVASAFPEYTVSRCFTSDVVIRRLSVQGIAVDSVDRALNRLIQQEYRQVTVMPTMITDGSEYQKLLASVAPFQVSFSRLTVARPLLDTTEDLESVASFIHNTFPLREQEALLLMGHGTENTENAILSAMADILQRTDPGLFLAALDGPPSLSDSIQTIRRNHCTKVCLAPLMLTAGTHTMKHLAGPSDASWLNRCLAAGLETRLLLSGLGSFPEIRELYLRHLSASLAEN